MMDNLTWTCHICREERPDARISVWTKPLGLPGVEGTQNIRYCNDRQECIDGAKDFVFIKAKEKHEYIEDDRKCMLIQWAKVHLRDGEPACPQCGKPAEMILGVFANPCYAHIPKEKPSD